MDFPQLLGPSYTSFSIQGDCQRLVNGYLERIESGAGRSQVALYKQFGLKPFVKLDGNGRGFLLDPTNAHLFAVAGVTIYDLLSDGTSPFTYGPIKNDGVPVGMDESLNTLFVVSSGTLYRVNSAALSTPAIPFAAAAVGVIGDLVVAVAEGSNQVFFSEDDGATWPALNYQAVQAFPNSLINLLVDHQELWLFGNRRIQVFVLSDNPDIPLTPIPSGLIEMGLAAKFALARLDNSIFWLGANRDGENVVYRANGYTPLRISNHAVENAFRGYGGVGDAIMSPFQLNGHSCLRLTFPSANGGLGATWQYDASMPPEYAWTECSSWNMRQGYEERHRAALYTSAFGKIYCSDHSNGWLYELSPDEFTDFGYPLRMTRRAPHITKDHKIIRYRKFEAVTQVGVGRVTPLWLSNYSLQAAAFATALAAAVGAATVTAAQALVLQAIYDQTPYTPLDPYPAPDTLDALGFYPWGTHAVLSDGTVRGGPPEMNMRYSNAGGEEGSFTPYYAKSLGKNAQFSKRLQWLQLGSARDRVYELMTDAPVKIALLQGLFDAEAGLN